MLEVFGVYNNLDHLPKAEQIKLKERYYHGESVYKLMEEYELHILPSAFYKLLPSDQVVNYGCRRCNVNLVTDSVPRSKQHQEKDPKQYYCPICGRKPFAEKSGWIEYPFLSKEEREKKREIIAEYYEKDAVPIEYDSLSLTQKVYLAVLCNTLLDLDRKTIRPLCDTEAILAATMDLQVKMYKELIKTHIIVVSAQSRLDAFDIDSNSFPKKYDRDKVCYKLNLKQPENTLGEIRRLLHINCSKEDSEVLQLWKEIAAGECITYLQYRLEKIGFPFTPGEKTKEVFQKLLEDFSVSQIYYIIWCKVNDASRWYLEGGVSKAQAANSVVGACLRYGNNAKLYDRELPQYQRPADCPRSELSRFFYYDILKLGSQADNTPPSPS